ncbi:MAG: transposase [Candidatus Dormiibacterota bacterium]
MSHFPGSRVRRWNRDSCRGAYAGSRVRDAAQSFAPPPERGHGRASAHPFLRNVASAVPKLHAPAVLAVVKSIFLQPTRATARDAVHHALNVLEPRFPTVAAKLRAAETDVLAYLDFPVDHWRSISSTKAIERVNAELDRHAKVVGIFPNTDSLLRLFTAVLQDQHDEWQDGQRTPPNSHHHRGLDEKALTEGRAIPAIGEAPPCGRWSSAALSNDLR